MLCACSDRSTDDLTPTASAVVAASDAADELGDFNTVTVYTLFSTKEKHQLHLQLDPLQQSFILDYDQNTGGSIEGRYTLDGNALVLTKEDGQSSFLFSCFGRGVLSFQAERSDSLLNGCLAWVNTTDPYALALFCQIRPLTECTEETAAWGVQYDVDGDGREEVLLLSFGGPNGIFTFKIEVFRGNDLVYNGYFVPGATWSAFYFAQGKTGELLLRSEEAGREATTGEGGAYEEVCDYRAFIENDQLVLETEEGIRLPELHYIAEEQRS